MNAARNHVCILTVVICALVAAPAGAVDLENWFFAHHSVGRYMIADGQIRQKVADYNRLHGNVIEFWDHDYNWIGLMHPDGVIREPDYNIPGDTRYPVGWHRAWCTENGARLRMVENHQVIAFKLGYLACQIASDDQLDEYKQYYLEIRDQFDAWADVYPDRVFVVIPPSPLHWRRTNLDEADRARAFAEWLKSPEYLAGHDNIYTWDLFDLLAHPDDGSPDRNMLRAEYIIPDEWDNSHPTYEGNLVIAQSFFDFMVDVATIADQAAVPGPDHAVRLLPNVPNPFNPLTKVRFSVAGPCEVDLRVYDLSGQLVRTLLNGAPRTGGDHAVVWDGRDASGRPAPAGVYLCRLEAAGQRVAGRMTLLK